MARRTFDVIDVSAILMHWRTGRSKYEMAASLRVDPKTLRKCIAPSVAAGIVPGGPAKPAEERAERVREWCPQPADTRLRQVTWPAIGEHHAPVLVTLIEVNGAAVSCPCSDTLVVDPPVCAVSGVTVPTPRGPDSPETSTVATGSPPLGDPGAPVML